MGSSAPPDDKPVLLVDDDTVDVMTVKRAFRQMGVVNQLVVKGDGEEALEYLKSTPVLPRLILLDLNMPRMNGLEFLQEIKSDEVFSAIPVIVLSTSGENSDVSACFRNSVVAYIVKQHSHDQFVRELRIYNTYWTTDTQAQTDL